MKPFSGAALGVVVAVVLFVMLLAMLMATLTVFNLDMADGFSEGTQAEALARAAVTQFIYEQDQTPPGSPLGSLPSPAATPSPFAVRYAPPNQVFPDGGAHLPGTVHVTFDATQPYFSIDNSLSDLPAAGWTDQGTANLSVPPYSVDLVVTVTTGRHTSHYEATVERRWPYVLAGPGVTLMGGSCGGGATQVSGFPCGCCNHSPAPGGSTHVQGAILEPTPLAGAMCATPVTVSGSMLQDLQTYSIYNPNQRSACCGPPPIFQGVRVGG
ncbi:MAG TPA: hypothetical protein VGO93_24905, partial [Candidatus Xenobia bacterium]